MKKHFTEFLKSSTARLRRRNKNFSPRVLSFKVEVEVGRENFSFRLFSLKKENYFAGKFLYLLKLAS